MASALGSWRAPFGWPGRSGGTELCGTWDCYVLCSLHQFSYSFLCLLKQSSLQSLQSLQVSSNELTNVLWLSFFGTASWPVRKSKTFIVAEKILLETPTNILQNKQAAALAANARGPSESNRFSAFDVRAF